MNETAEENADKEWKKKWKKVEMIRVKDKGMNQIPEENDDKEKKTKKRRENKLERHVWRKGEWSKEMKGMMITKIEEENERSFDGSRKCVYWGQWNEWNKWRKPQ